MKDKFYVTTAIPYVNAAPHIGHALEFVQADALARYHHFIGEEVMLLSGADENALKNVQAAERTGVGVQEFIDKNALIFADLARKLSVKFDVFQKGSNPRHHASAQKLWERCATAGDIYKKKYSGLYCVGCEVFYERGELDERGECREHPGKPLEEVSEENYFFRLSKYQDKITKLIQSDRLKVYPKSRKNEVLGFLTQGLHDISISRSNARARDWGVPVPGDASQRMYVWFDALNIYQSGVGFGWDEKRYNHWWPADVHVIGKGILRFHAVYWPAFLMSAKLALPKSIFVHGYVTVEGQKMSKTVGNVVDPFQLISKYGADPVRYYLLREIPTTGDGDFSRKRFKQIYTSDLANGLGNLVQRVSKLCQLNNIGLTEEYRPKISDSLKKGGYKTHLDRFELSLAFEEVWRGIKVLDIKINTDEPWNNPNAKKIRSYAKQLLNIAYALKLFLPDTSKKISEIFSRGKIIAPKKPLFPRL